jgi:hypothetical protein
MMKHALIAAGLLVTLATGAHANLLTNGSFEAVDASTCLPSQCRGSSYTPGWNQILAGVDLNHNNYTQPDPPNEVLVDASDGVQYLDMNQQIASSLGGIEQVVAVISGAGYLLTLDTTAWAKNAIGGTLGYELYDPASTNILASGSFTDSVGGTWVTRSLSAVAVSSSIGVRIQGLVAADAGMGLDNVTLTSVPEPATLLLLGSGLAGLGIISRRRKRH